jgi:hypothetical protein
MHNKAVTSHLAIAYGINVNYAPEQRYLMQIARLPRAMLDLADTLVAEFRGRCNQSARILYELLEFLNVDGRAPAKLHAMRHIDATFGYNLTSFPFRQLVSLDRWIELGAECSNVPTAYRPFLHQFAQPRDANTLRRIEAIHHASGPHAVQAFEIMKIVMERRGAPLGISNASIGDLVRMLRAHRPMSGFAGFTQWGPGDHGDPGANLDAHTLKHVCRQPATPEFGVYEAVIWWDLLRVRLTVTDYDRLTVQPTTRIRDCFDGNAPLRGDNLRRFMTHQGLNNEPALQQFVKNQALLPYRDFAIQSSRVMTDVIVQSDGGRVFISGAAGDAFIIGRYEGDQLGISSCYFPLDLNEKLTDAAAKLCWPLRAPARRD